MSDPVSTSPLPSTPVSTTSATTAPLRADLCIIGAGPAGYAAAMRAHDLGKHVILVERGLIGGAGIHAGALSSKTLWHLSNDYAVACNQERGYRAQSVEVSYRALMDTVRMAVSERRGQLERQLLELAAASQAGAAQGSEGQVKLVRGAARFLSPRRLQVTPAAEDGGAPIDIEADFYLIATGSRPRLPDGIQVDGERIVTSDHIESWTEFPRSLVVMGAGVIGCEYATMFANLRRTQIHLIDRQPRILPFEDEDVSEEVARSFERMGITIHRAPVISAMRVVPETGEVEFVLTDPNAPQPSRSVRVERALVSIGRVPNVEALDLAAAGVALCRAGGARTEQTATNVPHIYAAGDCSADVALANVAELEGRVAVERMFGLSPPAIRYEALSTIMFLAPEVAAVGINEQQARKLGLAYRYAVVSNRLVSRNIAMRSTTGFIKLLADPAGRILGLRVVGPQAASTAQGVAFLIQQGATLADIDRCLHPHPAIPEGVQECARLLLGKSVLKLSIFGSDLLRVGGFGEGAVGAA